MAKTITRSNLGEVLPANLSGMVDKRNLAKINELLSDPDTAETYRENLLSYSAVLQDGKFKLASYIDAINFVSKKMMGLSDFDSYVAVFPERYRRLKAKGKTDYEIASYVRGYTRGVLVAKILEQAIIPSWILNQDAYQEAINVQKELMHTAKSEFVRTKAADSLLNHLKRPEAAKIELDVGLKEDQGLVLLKQAAYELAKQQRRAIEDGRSNARDVAENGLIIEHDPQ